MKKSTVIWLAIALVLILAGGVMFSCVLSEYGWDFSTFDRENYLTKTVPVNQTFKNISIKAKTDDITIALSESGECSVVYCETDKIHHSTVLENDTLKIETRDERGWFEKLGFFSRKRPSVTLYLPKKEYDSLAVEAATGDIQISLPKEASVKNAAIAASTGDISCGMTAKETISVALSTGDITLENACADEIILSLTTGKINISGGECRNLSVAQSTGRTYLRDITCETFSSTASTGDITLENVYANEKLSIERTTGDITLSNCDAGYLSLKTTTGDVSGSLKTEKTFFTETDTGRVDVPKTLSNFTCEVHTTTGDITFTIEP